MGHILQRDEPSLDNTECHGPPFYSDPDTVFYPIPLIHDDEPVGRSPLQGDGPLPVPGQHHTAWSKIYEDPVGSYSCGNPNDLRGGGGGTRKRGGQILGYFQYIEQQILKII